MGHSAGGEEEERGRERKERKKTRQKHKMPLGMSEKLACERHVLIGQGRSGRLASCEVI